MHWNTSSMRKQLFCSKMLDDPACWSVQCYSRCIAAILSISSSDRESRGLNVLIVASKHGPARSPGPAAQMPASLYRALLYQECSNSCLSPVASLIQRNDRHAVSGAGRIHQFWPRSPGRCRDTLFTPQLSSTVRTSRTAHKNISSFSNSLLLEGVHL